MIDSFAEKEKTPLRAAGGMPDYASLSGWRAEDLPESDGIDFNTLFAAHRDGRTYGQAYGEISSAVKADSAGLMNVGTMAYMDAWQYSPASHAHVGQYTYVTANAVYGPGQGVQVAALSVGQRRVENPGAGDVATLTVYCPIAVPKVKEPPYGALRFMYAASAEIDAAYIASDEFDGWIYPDGKQYAVNPDQFSPDKNPFVTNEGKNPFVNGSTLTAPKLDRFIKANPFFEAAGGPAKCKFEDVPRHTALASHSHGISNLKLALTMGLDVNQSVFTTGDKYDYYDENCTHWGKAKLGEDDWKEVKAEITIAGNTGINIGLAECAEGSNNPQAVPRHDLVAVMVYVGGRRKEYKKIYVGS